jgi:hypothetical protein
MILEKLCNIFRINKKFIFINKGNKRSTIIQTIIKNLNVNSKDTLDDLLMPQIIKSSLTEIDKIKYVDVKTYDFLLERFYVENENKNNANEKKFFGENHKKFALVNIIEKNDKIILLGNPGLGKTVELEKLANYLWGSQDNDFIPIFRNLKNFTNLDTFEGYIKLKLNRFQNIIFILDGIDEITDIQDFTSKLENFIKKNEIEEKDCKFLLSCRTNVYERIVKSVYNFKIYYLKDLSYNQSVDLLKNKCGDIVNTFDLTSLNANFLKSPFQIDILANYINDKQTIPTNIAQLWKTYIENRFSIDECDKLKKVSLDITMINDYCKKVSLINELMKTNVINETYLLRILKKNYHDFNEFKKNPLIELQTNTKNWNFEHRNIQEYFAALSISELEIESIKKIIFIDKTNRTHPLLFNTITFLLNILNEDSDIFKELVDFLVIKEPELLFKSDSDRIIEAIRIKVFQNYFKSECIDKTFWIKDHRTFTVSEIAEFADCEENLVYLLNIINDEKYHFRIIISALDLLSYFVIPENKTEQLKNNFFVLLGSSISENIKSHILDCIFIHKFCISDLEYLNNIFKLFRNETNKEINKALLCLMEDCERIDDFYWYINSEFLRERGIVKRELEDDVLRGNDWILERLIIRFEFSNNFINFVKYYFDENSDHYDDTFAQEIVIRCLYFENLEDDFLVNLLSSFKSTKEYFFRENLLKTIILKSKPSSQIMAFQYLIHNYSFNSIGYFLASITNSETIDIVVENFRNKTIESKELDFFRNVIAKEVNRELAGKFNNLIIKNGFAFAEKYLFEKEFQEIKKKYESIPQNNFDILFDKEKFTLQVQKIFDENNGFLDKLKLREIQKKWYTENGHSSRIAGALSFLRKLIFNSNEPIRFNDIKKNIEDEFTIIAQIKLEIEELNDTNNKFNISDEQKEFIFSWCKQASKDIRFDKILQPVDNYNFYVLEDYSKFKYLMFFVEKFDFNLGQNFFLNSIEFFVINNSRQDEKSFDKISKRIFDKKILHNRIINNLLQKDLTYISLTTHIQYALDNNLSITFPKIKKHLLHYGINHNVDKQLVQFHSLTSDLNFLKECCYDLNSSICWSALRIMADKDLDSDFRRQKALEYFKLEVENKLKLNYYSNALVILFQLNSLDALIYFNFFLENNQMSSFSETSFSNYDAIDDFNILIDFFDKIYLHNGYDRPGIISIKFLNQYISNLSKKESSHEKVIDVLNKKREVLKTSNNNDGLFYINILIDNSNDSYLNSKSIAMKFDEALKKVEEILN